MTIISSTANSGSVASDDYSNTTTNAQEISLNTQIIGNLEVSDDVDYFKFALTERTTVEFEKQSVVGSVGNAAMANFDVLQIYGFTITNVLDERVSSYSAEKHVMTLEAGTYYIGISTLFNTSTGYQFILNVN